MSRYINITIIEANFCILHLFVDRIIQNDIFSFFIALTAHRILAVGDAGVLFELRRVRVRRYGLTKKSHILV